jgi:hypothetical protein
MVDIAQLLTASRRMGRTHLQTRSGGARARPAAVPVPSATPVPAAPVDSPESPEGERYLEVLRHPWDVDLGWPNGN